MTEFTRHPSDARNFLPEKVSRATLNVICIRILEEKIDRQAKVIELCKEALNKFIEYEKLCESGEDIGSMLAYAEFQDQARPALAAIAELTATNKLEK